MRQVFHCETALLDGGWREDVSIIVDNDGFIERIEPGRPAEAQTLPGPVLPGMVNVHSHIHQRLMAGLSGHRAGAHDSFWSWRELMYRAIDLLDGESLEALAAFAFMELIEGGYTSVGEFHYPHRLGGQSPQRTSRQVMDAAARAGCALTLLPVWYCHGGFGREALGERQRAFALTLSELGDLVAGLRQVSDRRFQRIGVAPHSLRAVDAGDLPALLEAVPEGPVHLHISEQPAEVEACLKVNDCRPVELLARHVTLDERWCLIHATHAGEAEREAIAASDAVVGICPTTEADLGDGLFPVRELLARGGRVAVGSDSNLVTSAAEELRLLEWGQRLVGHERNVLCAAGENVGTALWRDTAAAGARALAQPAGSLAPGRRADFVVLDRDHPLLAGLSGPEQLDSFVFSHAAGMIDEVWIAGRRLVSAGRHAERNRLATGVAGLRARLAGRMRA